MINIHQARNTDPTVAMMLKRGAPFEQIVCALAEEKQAMMNQIIQLHSIAPKKITGADGKTYVWHCPDELVPIQRV